MTNEEIIDNLKYQNKKFFGGQGQALMEAIQMLEQQPCEDAISRAEVLKIVESFNNPTFIEPMGTVRNILKDLPPVTPTRKVGKLIAIDDTHSQCTECGETFSITSSDEWEVSFCPNCGAEMVGNENG